MEKWPGDMKPCSGEATGRFGGHRRNETTVQKWAYLNKIIKMVRFDGRKLNQETWWRVMGREPLRQMRWAGRVSRRR